MKNSMMKNTNWKTKISDYVCHSCGFSMNSPNQWGRICPKCWTYQSWTEEPQIISINRDNFEALKQEFLDKFSHSIIGGRNANSR